MLKILSIYKVWEGTGAVATGIDLIDLIEFHLV
jgi:hypothetical protein